MKKYDFKSFHIRAANARTEEEKNAINAELKEWYNQLPEAEKPAFNQALQEFLIKEYAAISGIYEQVRGTESLN